MCWEIFYMIRLMLLFWFIRSEFLNQYLGGSTIFMKAKRSLTSSFDHLLKRRGSRDDFGPMTKELSLPMNASICKVSWQIVSRSERLVFRCLSVGYSICNSRKFLMHTLLYRWSQSEFNEKRWSEWVIVRRKWTRTASLRATDRGPQRWARPICLLTQHRNRLPCRPPTRTSTSARQEHLHRKPVRWWICMFGSPVIVSSFGMLYAAGYGLGPMSYSWTATFSEIGDVVTVTVHLGKAKCTANGRLCSVVF